MLGAPDHLPDGKSAGTDRDGDQELSEHGPWSLKDVNSYMTDEFVTVLKKSPEAQAFDMTSIDLYDLKVMESLLNVFVWQVYADFASGHEHAVLVNPKATNKLDMFRVKLPVAVEFKLPCLSRVSMQGGSKNATSSSTPCCKLFAVAWMDGRRVAAALF